MSDLTRQDLVDLRSYVGERFDRLEARLDQQDSRLRQAETALAAVGPDVTRVHVRVGELEPKVEAHGKCLNVLKDRSGRPGAVGAATGGGAGLLMLLGWEWIKSRLGS